METTSVTTDASGTNNVLFEPEIYRPAEPQVDERMSDEDDH
jgi:hypothetical protein